MMFFLTPQSGWISGAHAPSSSVPEQVPVDQLEDSDSCLWCDGAPQAEPCAEDDAAWNASERSDEECTDEKTGTGPSA